MVLDLHIFTAMAGRNIYAVVFTVHTALFISKNINMFFLKLAKIEELVYGYDKNLQ